MNLRAKLFLPLCLPGLLLADPDRSTAQSLRGSPGSIDRMYRHAVDNGIYFYRSGEGIREAAKEGRFVRLRGNRYYSLRDVSYPYVRPTTRTFVERLARQLHRACGERLVVTSAARPRSMSLRNSVRKTVHPTGIAVDLRMPRRSRCRSWLRNTLLSLERQGVVEATEERSPPHFHVAVFPRPYQRLVEGRQGGATERTATSSPSRYRVRPGDSLWGIARRHRVTVDRLKEENRLHSSTLRVGQVLRIPQGP